MANVECKYFVADQMGLYMTALLIWLVVSSHDVLCKDGIGRYIVEVAVSLLCMALRLSFR